MRPCLCSQTLEQRDSCVRGITNPPQTHEMIFLFKKKDMHTHTRTETPNCLLSFCTVAAVVEFCFFFNSSDVCALQLLPSSRIFFFLFSSFCQGKVCLAHRGIQVLNLRCQETGQDRIKKNLEIKKCERIILNAEL